MDAEPQISPHIPWWARPKVARKHPKSIVPRVHKAVSDTLYYRAAQWVLPWSMGDYPGKRIGLVELLGVSWHTLEAYRRGRRRLPGRVAALFAELIEARCTAGLALVAELREIERTYISGRSVPRGWRVVRDRGNGELRDGRGGFRAGAVPKAKPDGSEPKRRPGRPRKRPRDNPASSD